ncbi:hypothetical protein A0H81_04763 [Grifola frondosa]|uniref:Uncharacterized protein n=1 Tax=Grifola frondosa TaxID=5627 RepID=A0A1C7MFH6_GRIFR|nr:hypothetical protein A0H81_04763 [Grifola frondosa]
MSQSVFSSFDPLATHPFTNNSGLLPKPTRPSQFPHSIVSNASANRSPSSTTFSATSLQSPQPKRPSSSFKSTSGAPRPVFVPFRPERSSPDLDDILLKKKFSDVFANKKSWSIDQSVVPLPSAIASAGRQGGKAQ